ncbi:ParB N-terminal domain-containing protein [Pseudonocardia sp. NPDC049635]|uniref:ParB/RepB/Spo0J family partition protein n=1 Tax=Pseudonocardia sp. NPDC049635 TaxID=3155506 RepID=UPI003410676E
MSAEPNPTGGPAVTEATAFGRLVLVDPNTLELEVNTRLDANLDPHFCASIRDRGVQEPITVRRRASDGTLVVRTGQRRTLAAVRVGLSQVPVIIAAEPAVEDGDEVDTTGEDYRAGQTERIVEQLVENQHRRAITDAEEVTAHQQLLGLGLTPAQIARATRTKAERVRRSTQVAANARATAIGSRYELDLMQMSVIAEFADDDEAVKQLTDVAVHDPERFRHLTQRLRDQRGEAQVRAAAVAELTEAGVRVIDRDDDHYAGAAELYRLRPSPNDPEGTVLVEQDHRDCPGHAAHVLTYRHFGDDGPQARVEWLCLDPAGHGHAPLRESMRTPTSPGAGVGGGASEGEQERADREAREKEAARAERRRVIENNKAWASAQIVRREWLAELLGRKAAPKGAAIYVAAELGQGAHALRTAMETGNALACELLGLDAPSGGGYYSGRVNPLAEAARAAGAARATMLSLAFVLGAYEAATHRGNWRTPEPGTQRYLTQLRVWGYTLSEVEQLALDPHATTDTDDAPDDGDGPAGGDDEGCGRDEPGDQAAEPTDDDAGPGGDGEAAEDSDRSN